MKENGFSCSFCYVDYIIVNFKVFSTNLGYTNKRE